MTHNAEAHKRVDSITFAPDCVECWRERFLLAMWLDRVLAHNPSLIPHPGDHRLCSAYGHSLPGSKGCCDDT